MSFARGRCAPLSDILREGFQTADEGDLSLLLSLGVPRSIIHQAQNFPPRRRNRVCDLIAAHLGNMLHRELGNEFHLKRLEAILVQVAEHDCDEIKQDELILHKAPREMMNCLSGMTYQEFATRRALLGVIDQGRPRKASDKQQQAVWNSWRAHAELSYAQRFLHVVQDTHLDLRTIWPILRSGFITPKSPSSRPIQRTHRRTTEIPVRESY